MNLEQQDKQYVLQTYARNYTNFVKGVGSTLYDESGKDYIDFAFGNKNLSLKLLSYPYISKKQSQTEIYN